MAKTVLYVGTDNGVVTLAVDDGSCVREAEGLQEWPVLKVAFSREQPQRVFAGTRGDGVWMSDDAGKTWKKPSYGRRGPGKVQSLTLDPHNPQKLYAGGEPIDLFVSEDCGASWQPLDSVWSDPFVQTITYPVSTVEPHVRDVAVDPNDSNTMYLALQVGYMLKTQDGGQTWHLLNEGLDADVHTIAINPRKTNEILIATGGHDSRGANPPGKALYRSEDGGETWSATAMEFYQEYSLPVVRNPQQPDVAYASLARGYERLWQRPSGAEGVVIRTTDGGRSWQPLTNGLDDPSQCMAVALAVDEDQPSRVYAALNDGSIMGSRDGGDSWEKLSVNVPRINDVKVASV